LLASWTASQEDRPTEAIATPPQLTGTATGHAPGRGAAHEDEHLVLPGSPPRWMEADGGCPCAEPRRPAGESLIGLPTTEPRRRRGPWRGLHQVEPATLGWVDWSKDRRLHDTCRDVPPMDAPEHMSRRAV
jgi:hypothetical protein